MSSTSRPSRFLLGLFTAAAVTTAGAAAAEPLELRAAAPSTPVHAVYFEAGGAGLAYSINYERALTGSFSLRAGLGVFAGPNVWGITAVPITAQYLVGEGAHRLELGAGLVPMLALSNLDEGAGEATALMATGTLGYRYQPPAGGWLFRAGLTPLVTDEGVLPWAGLSLGRHF